MRALFVAAIMLIGVSHGSIWNSADHIGHNDIGFCVKSAVSGPLIDEIANGGMMEFAAIGSAIFNAGDYFKDKLVASPFAHINGLKIRKLIYLRGEYSSVAVLCRRIMVIERTQGVTFRYGVEFVRQNEHVIAKANIYRRGLPKILHYVVDLNQRVRWPKRPDGRYVDLYPGPPRVAHFIQLSLHYSGLSSKEPQLFPIKSVSFAVLHDVEYNDHRCENCVYADPDSSPKIYAERAFVVGGIIFICGIVIFGQGYVRAGKGRYAGLMVCIGWIVQFVGVGLICLGVLALS